MKRTDDNGSSLENDDDNGNSNNGVIEDFKKSKEELKKQREEKIKELEELDKQLQPASSDSTRYHYQPRSPKAPAQPKKEAGNQASIKKVSHPFFTNDLLFLRFLI